MVNKRFKLYCRGQFFLGTNVYRYRYRYYIIVRHQYFFLAIKRCLLKNNTFYKFFKAQFTSYFWWIGYYCLLVVWNKWIIYNRKKYFQQKYPHNPKVNGFIGLCLYNIYKNVVVSSYRKNRNKYYLSIK